MHSINFVQPDISSKLQNSIIKFIIDCIQSLKITVFHYHAFHGG